MSMLETERVPPPSDADAPIGDDEGWMDPDSPDAIALQEAQAGAHRQESSAPIDRLRARLFVGMPAIAAIPRKRPLVADLLDLDSLVVLYGAPGSGKSFLMWDVGLNVATGSWWHGRQVTKGPVLYVVLEGSGGIANRTQAWSIQNRYYGEAEGFAVLAAGVNILDAVEVSALGMLASELQPVLIVIDTLSRAMPGGNENGPEDMGRAVRAADTLRTRTGACVALVHHSGKDQSAGSRGHTSLLGAVDTELELKSTDSILRLTTTKQKDKPTLAQPDRFELVTVALPGVVDDHGNAVTSCAVAPYTGRTTDDAGLRDSDRKALAALVRIAVPGGISNSRWSEVATDPAGPEPIGRSTFMASVKSLLDRDLVQNLGTEKRPSYMPVTRENS